MVAGLHAAGLDTAAFLFRKVLQVKAHRPAIIVGIIDQHAVNVVLVRQVELVGEGLAAPVGVVALLLVGSSRGDGPSGVNSR